MAKPWTATILSCALAAMSGTTSADQLTSRIGGSMFSPPATIGTFRYALPAGTSPTQMDLIGVTSGVFTFPAAPGNFTLSFALDSVGFTQLNFTPADTSFSLTSTSLRSAIQGSPLFFNAVAATLVDGSAELSVRCAFGPCPSVFTQTSGHWTLTIGGRFTLPSPAAAAAPVPASSSLLLALTAAALCASAGVALRRRRRRWIGRSRSVPGGTR